MRLKNRVLAGERLTATILTVPDPSLAELVGTAFDHVWIDLEHSTLDVRDLLSLVTALKAAGASSVVRLPIFDTERLSAILDAGVDGVVAPRITTAEQAAAFVALVHYPPAGSRGFGPRRAGGYGRTSSFWTSEEAEPALFVQIESADAVRSSEQIAAVDGVDALVIGTADLSFDLGNPQVVDSDEFHAQTRQVRTAAESAGKAFGVAAGSATALAALLGTGTIAVLSVDVRLYAAAIDAAAAGLRDSLERSPAAA
jgi:2-keto-3-deoxy-L-rhamnonate aldolase RhmA